MATIVTVACDNITKKCTGKITGEVNDLKDQEGINRWLNSIKTVNSPLPSAKQATPLAGSAESLAGSSAESSAGSEPPERLAAGEAGSAAGEAGSAPVGSANSSALVAFKSSPVGRSIDTNTFNELLAFLSGQAEPERNQFFTLLSSVSSEQVPAFLKNIEPLLKKPNNVRNRVFNKLLENPPSDLSQALVLREGGRKTRTSHKRRKASKKTRKAQ